MLDKYGPLGVLVEFLVVFFGFYLLGIGLWTIIHTAQAKT